MRFMRNFWDRLSEHVLSPKVDPDELERLLNEARNKLPAPVIWLLGKTQSGKTSIIRAMTGSTQAEIGNGFRPCTRTAQMYSFPGDSDCLVRFLDTRGLGEVGYDPAEDLAFCKEQAHLVIVVIKAMDHAQAAVLQPLREIRRAKPNWPVIAAQTCLHEGYSKPSDAHILPYPFESESWPSAVPTTLSRSLDHQRAEFAGLVSQFVPIDFTLPEDGFIPVDYGLEPLWDTIENVFPLGLRGVLQSHADLREKFDDVYFSTAQPHIVSYALAAGAAGAVPVPLVDVPVVLAIQAKMFHAIASIYGQQLTKQLMMELGGSFGLGIGARLLGRELFKLIPFAGSAVAGVYAAASTYALGCTLCKYFGWIRSGNVPDAATLRAFYAEELAEGRKRFAEFISRGCQTTPNSNTAT